MQAFCSDEIDVWDMEKSVLAQCCEETCDSWDTIPSVMQTLLMEGSEVMELGKRKLVRFSTDPLTLVLHRLRNNIWMFELLDAEDYSTGETYFFKVEQLEVANEVAYKLLVEYEVLDELKTEED